MKNVSIKMLAHMLHAPIEITDEEWMKKWNSNRDKVPGWCEPESRNVLFNIGLLTEGNAIEIGSCFGLSTVYFAAGMKVSGGLASKLICIDPFKQGWKVTLAMNNADEKHKVGMPIDSLSKEFTNNLDICGVTDKVEVIKEFSGKVSERFRLNAYGSVFIDGDHNYEGVKSDWLLYFPKVRINGFVVFHDVGAKGWDGPNKLRLEIEAKEIKVVEKIMMDHNILVYRKIKDF